MRIIRFVLAIVVVFVVLFLTACASGGGSPASGNNSGNNPSSGNPPSQPPPAPTATLTSSASSIFQGEFFLLTWSSTNAGFCQGSGGWVGSKDLNGSESVTSVMVGQTTFSIECTDLGGRGTTIASVSVTVNAAQPPTIRILPASIEMKLGETADFIVETTGLPNPPPTCSQPSVGFLQLLGSVIKYSADVKDPASLNTEFTCSVTNFAGTDSARVPISLSYPAPVVSSVVEFSGKVEDTALFCLRDFSCFIRLFKVRGSGFYPGGAFHAGYFGDFTLPSGFLTGPKEIILFLAFDTARFSPGDIDFSVSSPPDIPGGGTSNIYKFPFLGGQNTLARLSDGYALVNQGFIANPEFGSSGLHIFDSAVRELRVFDATDARGTGNYHVPGVAVTRVALFGELTDMILTTRTTRVLFWDPLGGYHGFSGFSREENGRPGGVAAKGDWGCVTEEFQNLLSCFEVFHGVPPLVSTVAGGFPAYIAMTDLPPPNALTTVAVVLNLGDGSLAVFDVPSLSAVRYIDLPGFTTLSKLPAPGRGGGWHLAVLEYDINLPGLPLFPVRVAAVISRFDRKVWFIDLSTGQVSGPFSLDGEAFRIVADNASRNFVVAVVNENRAVGGTRFVKIDPAGTITVPTNDKVDILSIGLQISPDGSTRVSCQRAICKAQPNN